jgi:glc operon protein GlcG
MSRWAALAVALAGLAVSFQHASAQLAQRKLLTLAAAQKMVAAARAEAERRHLAGVIAVVDDGGCQSSSCAWTIRPTLPASNSRPAKPAPRRSSRSQAGRRSRRSITVASRPLRRGTSSRCKAAFRSWPTARFGGIGASFDTPEQDLEIAEVGLAAFTH